MKIEDVRPLQARKVAIVGFSETTRGKAPYEDPAYEIWVCNRLALQPGIVRWDRHFDPHPISWTKLNFKPEDWTTYEEFLRTDHGPAHTIYLPYEDAVSGLYPNAAPFPFELIVEAIGRQYVSSAISWELGLALALGAETIGMWGIDLRHQTEWSYQRPCAEWMLGIAQGRGVEIILPPETSLLNTDGNCELYGVSFHSGVLGELDKAMQARVKDLQGILAGMQKENTDLLDKMHHVNGSLQEALITLERTKQRRAGGAF